MEDLFEKVRRIQLSERGHAGLSLIDPELYAQLRARLSLLEQNPDAKTPEEARECRNIRRVASDVIARRRQKIVAKAQRDLANNQISSESLTREEREFYLSFIALLKNLDAAIETGGSAKIANETENETQKTAGLEEKTKLQNSAGDLKAGPTEAKREKTGDKTETAKKKMKVKFLRDVPEFLSSGLESLGPFSKSEVAEIPAEDARILLSRNLAAAE